MNNVIVLGGTFNPLSRAHSYIIKSAKRKFKISKVILVPTSDDFLLNWKQYDKQNILPLNLRLKILEGYKKRNRDTEISTLESSGKTSKTYDTLNEILKENIGSKLYFLCGSEKINEIQKWYHSEDLIRMYDFIFIERNGDNASLLINNNHFYDKYRDHLNIIKQNNKMEYISSTKIRELINKKDYDGLKEMTFDYVIRDLKKEGIL